MPTTNGRCSLAELVGLVGLVCAGFGCSSSGGATDDAAADTGADTVAESSTDAAADTPVDAAPEVDPEGCVLDPGPADPGIDPATYPTLAPADFTLDKALAGFPSGTGVLRARITTQQGRIDCRLDPTAAPISVANFVGLARGTRPFRKGTAWMLGRFYDGLKWHRVVPGFVIQGGDPRGNGTGGPGYSLVDENHVDEPLGTLAMAAGTAPSGSQFYIVVGKGPPPDYNVFGSCDTPVAVAISELPADSKAAPLTEVNMQRIDIVRCPK